MLIYIAGGLVGVCLCSCACGHVESIQHKKALAEMEQRHERLPVKNGRGVSKLTLRGTYWTRLLQEVSSGPTTLWLDVDVDGHVSAS